VCVSVCVCVCRMMSAILNLGNIDFAEDASQDGSVVENKEQAQICAQVGVRVRVRVRVRVQSARFRQKIGDLATDSEPAL